MPWEWSITQRDDGENVILICGEAQRGEQGWIVAEMPYLDHPDLQQEQSERAEVIKWAWETRDLLRRALADLEGIMPEFEPSGDREHPAWETTSRRRTTCRRKTPRRRRTTCRRKTTRRRKPADLMDVKNDKLGSSLIRGSLGLPCLYYPEPPA